MSLKMIPRKFTDSGYINIFILSVSFVALLISHHPEVNNELVENNEVSTIVLKEIAPESCRESSKLDNDFSCYTLFDNDIYTFWADNLNYCSEPTWIEFFFSDEFFIEFIVLRNVEFLEILYATYSIKNLQVLVNDEIVATKEMANDNFSEWIDINKKTSSLKIQVLDSYPSKEYNEFEPLEACTLHEIVFYGRALP